MFRPSVRPRPNPKRRSPGRKRRELTERQIAWNTTSRLRNTRYAHDLETAVSQPGADLPCARVCLAGTELLEPRATGSFGMAGQTRRAVGVARWRWFRTLCTTE